MKEYLVPVPQSVGPGTAVEVRDAAAAKTIHYKGSATDLVYLEISADGSTWVRDPNLSFAGSSPVQRHSFETIYVRAYRTAGTGGTFALAFVADQLSPKGTTSISYVKEAETSASETTGARPFGQVRGSRRVSAVTLVPQADVPADPANYAGVNVLAKSSAGGADRIVSSVHSGPGWTAYHSINCPLGSRDLVDLDSLYLVVGKSGAGAQLPLFALHVHFEP